MLLANPIRVSIFSLQHKLLCALIIYTHTHTSMHAHLFFLPLLTISFFLHFYRGARCSGQRNGTLALIPTEGSQGSVRPLSSSSWGWVNQLVHCSFHASNFQRLTSFILLYLCTPEADRIGMTYAPPPPWTIIYDVSCTRKPRKFLLTWLHWSGLR
jgi:hypothetical protein